MKCNLLPAEAGSFHSGATCPEAQAYLRVFRPGYFALRTALLRPQPTPERWFVLEAFYAEKDCSLQPYTLRVKEQSCYLSRRVP